MTTMSHLESIDGSDEFLSASKHLRSRVLSQLPPDLKLPSSLLENLPKNVTSIPTTCGLLTANELAITSWDATRVRDTIAAGRLTAVEAVSAFGRRAAIAHQLVNCLVDFFLDEAIERAKELDRIFQATGSTVGPLHGVPISIKDHIMVKGRWTSNGFHSGVHQADEDADLVSILLKLGAVLYVKTNQPQTIMHLETHSTYGRTLNPHNIDLTPGGSSGGESALIALHGSCLGVGTDGGGSIRQPAGNTGIYGLRPTTKTFPLGGYLFYMPGCDSFGISTGPMCTSRRDIDLFMISVLATDPHLDDPALFRQSWVETPRKQKLKIGVMRSDGVVLPQPPMLRAFDHVVERLRSSGEVDVVTFEPYKQRHGLDILRSLYFEDGGANIEAALKVGGETPVALTRWLLDTPLTALHNVWEGWRVRDARDRYLKEYAARWRDAGIDVLLCPPFPGTACQHDTAKYWGYTAVYNLLDYPGVVFPTGLFADSKVDVKVDRSDFSVDAEGSDQYNHDKYEPILYDGAPICLQLLAYRFDDFNLMKALETVEGILAA